LTHGRKADASAIFRDAQNFETPSTGDVKYSVTLLDPDFETSRVFEKVLDLITKGAVTFPSIKSDPARERKAALYRYMWQFATKWDCVPLRGVLKSRVHALVADGDIDAVLAFALGALFDHPRICHNALKCTTWDYVFFTDEGMVDLLEMGNWPTWVWSLCPPAYMGALEQAHLQTRYDHTRELHEHFLQCLAKFGR
jgi:hypothetical protein